MSKHANVILLNECSRWYKGVDKGGGLGGLKPPPPIFWQTLYYGGVVMQKVGVVVQKFHVRGLQPPHF